MTATLRARACPACNGEQLKLKANKVAEDAVETWVECACGARGECVEDAYSDPEGAIAQWNRFPVEQARAA